MLRLIFSYVYTLIALTAAIVTLLLYNKNLFGTLSEDGKLGVYFIGTFAFIFFFESIIYKIKVGRNSRYSESLTLLNKGFENIHKIARENNVTTDSIVASLENLCTQLAQAFTNITASRCSVCIKILSEGKAKNKGKLKIETLCRDLYSKSDRSIVDIKEHLVEKNTDFLTILKDIDKPSGKYFISNQLPFRFDYQNSSFEFYNDCPDEGTFLFFKIFLRYWRWPLPYKSTIVVPICPGISTERSKETLLGFLCVDSPRLFVFKKFFDIDIMNGVADGLYNVILKLKETLKQN